MARLPARTRVVGVQIVLDIRFEERPLAARIAWASWPSTITPPRRAPRRQARNYTQAFQHVPLLSTAHNLGRATKPAEQRAGGGEAVAGQAAG